MPRTRSWDHELVKGWGGEVKLAAIVEGYSTTACHRQDEGWFPMTQRRIAFVTGGAGFIGSNIVAKLAEDRTLDVVVCDRLREADLGKWKNIAKHAIGDFVAPEDMFDWLEKRWRDIEVVVHMAAISSTHRAGRRQDRPFELSRSPRDLFRWCADRQRRFIYASSAATYGDGANGFDDDNGYEALAALRPL